MQHKTDHNQHQYELQPPEPENDERRRRIGDVLHVDARVAAEMRGEREQRHEFRDGDRQPARDIVEAMQEGNDEGDESQRRIDDDDRRPQPRIHEQMLRGIGEGEEGDQVGDDVQDLETPLHGQRITLGAVGGQPRQPCLRAGGQAGCRAGIWPAQAPRSWREAHLHRIARDCDVRLLFLGLTVVGPVRLVRGCRHPHDDATIVDADLRHEGLP